MYIRMYMCRGPVYSMPTTAAPTNHGRGPAQLLLWGLPDPSWMATPMRPPEPSSIMLGIPT